MKNAMPASIVDDELQQSELFRTDRLQSLNFIVDDGRQFLILHLISDKFVACHGVIFAVKLSQLVQLLLWSLASLPQLL